jgi:hypothetical protein
MEMARFFVTDQGLTVSLADPHVLNDITAILEGDATEDVIDAYIKKGLIEPDRRPVERVDHNLMILSGAVKRLQQLAQPRADGDGAKPLSDEDAATMQDLRTIPRKLYRLSAKAGKVTTNEMRKLPSGARKVLVALRQEQVGTTKTLAAHTGLNRRTVENALTSLRTAKLIETTDARDPSNGSGR